MATHRNKKRSWLGRRLAVMQLGELGKSDRARILAVLDEYARKADGEGPLAPDTLSNLEISLLTADRMRFEQEAEAHGKAAAAVAEATRSAYSAYETLKAQADDAGEYKAADPNEDPQVRSTTEQLDEVRGSLAAILDLRNSLSGREAIRPLLHPKLMTGLTLAVWVTQSLMFTKMAFEALANPQHNGLSFVIDVVLAIAIGVAAPSVVAISAVVLGRVFGSRRAENTIASLGLGGTVLRGRVPDHHVGALAQAAAWLRSNVSEAWAGVATIAAFAFTTVSAVLILGSTFGIDALQGAAADVLEGPLQVVGVVLIILPIGVLVANLAGDNPFKQAVLDAEARLERAEEAAASAQKEFTAREQERERRHAHVQHEADRAATTWKTSRQNLDAARKSLVAMRASVEAVFKASSGRILAIERGLNDRLPLAFDERTHANLVASSIREASQAVEKIYDGWIAVASEALGATQPAEETSTQATA